MNQRIQIQPQHPSREHTLSQLVPGAPLEQDSQLLEKLQQAIAKLLEAVDSALNGDRAGAEDCINSVGALLQPAGITPPANTSSRLGRTAAEKLGAPARPPAPIRGGLAPWQMRQVTTHIDTQLGSSITTNDLARIARLSPCHFSRAFRESFGDSPHKYVMRRRVERAQGLMLSTDLSLGQIAVECGLADQAHLCKLFLKIVGESPGMWRRARSGQ
jgi:AraC-like DNA-binding protein